MGAEVAGGRALSIEDSDSDSDSDDDLLTPSEEELLDDIMANGGVI
jgi:hypothetical protein